MNLGLRARNVNVTDCGHIDIPKMEPDKPGTTGVASVTGADTVTDKSYTAIARNINPQTASKGCKVCSLSKDFTYTVTVTVEAAQQTLRGQQIFINQDQRITELEKQVGELVKKAEDKEEDKGKDKEYAEWGHPGKDKDKKNMGFKLEFSMTSGWA